MFTVTLFDVTKLNKAKTVEAQWKIICESQSNSQWKTRGQARTYEALRNRMEKLEEVQLQLDQIVKDFKGHTMPQGARNLKRKLEKRIENLNRATVFFEGD